MKRKNFVFISKEYLILQYITNQKTCKEIGKELNCSWGKINTWLKKYEIPIRKSLSGKELAKMYGHETRFKKGHEPHKIFHPRGEHSKTSKLTEKEAILMGRITQWTDYKEWSTKIINVRGNKCEICLKHQSELPNKLFLHHKKPRKTHPELCFDETNVVVICRQCHPKVEFTGKKIHER